jgi:ABC-type branched-subunit amino acid transport system ATPase component
MVPEGSGTFSEVTVRDNFWPAYTPHARARASEARDLDLVLSLFPRRKERLT